MAIDIFLKLDGIEGESLDHVHHGAIELDSYSFGVSNPGSHATGGGAGAGKVSFQELHFTSKVSKASPILLLDCASGRHIKIGVIAVRKAGAPDFLVITLTNVLITSVLHDAPSRDDIPHESVSLVFAEIKFEYHQQKPDGTIGAAVTFGWDLGHNRAI